MDYYTKEVIENLVESGNTYKEETVIYLCCGDFQIFCSKGQISLERPDFWPPWDWVSKEVNKKFSVLPIRFYSLGSLTWVIIDAYRSF